jgi:hypothetical protein
LRIAAVAKAVAVVVVNIEVIGVRPVLGPFMRPRIQDHERIAAIGKPRIAHVHHGLHLQPEVMTGTEIEAVGVLRDVITAPRWSEP